MRIMACVRGIRYQAKMAIPEEAPSSLRFDGGLLHTREKTRTRVVIGLIGVGFESSDRRRNDRDHDDAQAAKGRDAKIVERIERHV